MMPTISPYKASASAKMRIKIMPTKSLGCWALALQTKTSLHVNKQKSSSSDFASATLITNIAGIAFTVGVQATKPKLNWKFSPD
jgi:hypothetical protein